MSKRAGNPNWGKPEMNAPVVTITEFDKLVTALNLTPDQYVRSEELKTWAQKNKNLRYVPEPLLVAWGFEIETNI